MSQAPNNTEFQAYLNEHHLDPREVAVQSHVRYVTVWSILKNSPITSEHAAQVRVGLYHMTGIAYWGWIKVLFY